MKIALALVALCGMVGLACSARGEPVPPQVRAAIDAGNQAWIDGVKAGDVASILATYAEGAVDCGPTGECITGRAQIEQHMTAQLGSLGRAQSATVHSWGSTQQGNFVYEWGQAEATFAHEKLTEKYLTAWQKQADGSWKIFRNLVIPDK